MPNTTTRQELCGQCSVAYGVSSGKLDALTGQGVTIASARGRITICPCCKGTGRVAVPVEVA